MTAKPPGTAVAKIRTANGLASSPFGPYDGAVPSAVFSSATSVRAVELDLRDQRRALGRPTAWPDRAPAPPRPGRAVCSLARRMK